MPPCLPLLSRYVRRGEPCSRMALRSTHRIASWRRTTSSGLSEPAVRSGWMRARQRASEAEMFPVLAMPRWLSRSGLVAAGRRRRRNAWSRAAVDGRPATSTAGGRAIVSTPGSSATREARLGRAERPQRGHVVPVVARADVDDERHVEHVGAGHLLAHELRELLDP